MDIWGIIAILGGITIGLVAISVLLKYSGVGEFLGHMLSLFSTFVSTVWSGLGHLISAAPKPIRIVLFVLLFLFLGGIIYNSTIGVTHACLEGEVYEMDILSGMSLMLIPDAIEAQYTEFVGLPADAAGGVISTDSQGNPFIIVPNLYARGTDAKLTGTSGTGGIGQKEIFYDFSLEFEICKTSDGACYLSDVTLNNPWCRIEDTGGDIVADGNLIYKVWVTYDPSKSEEETQGLEFLVKSVGVNFWSFITLGYYSPPFDLAECGTDSTYPWLATAGIESVALGSPYGTAELMYNAKKVAIVKRTANATGLKKVREEIVASHSDPEYASLAEKAKTKSNFIKTGREPVSYKGDEFVRFTCEDDETQDETLLIAGLPVLNKEFVLIVVFLIILLSIISYIRGNSR